VRAAGLHVSPLREFIHLLKYEQRPDLAPLLGRYLVAAFALPDWDDLRPYVNVTVPVPLHAQRRRERGYNQAELLAAELCRQLRLPLRTELLTRVRFTQSQVGLSAAERHVNVEDAFAAATACRGLHILLVDDVYTTGATLRACAEAAVAAGAASVSALTLALPAHGEEPHDPSDSTHAR
jgi:ComF family protein